MNMLHRSAGNNNAVFLFKIGFLANSLFDSLFQPHAVFRMNPAPEQRNRGLLVAWFDAQNSIMLTRPFNLAVCHIPLPTASVTQLLAFFEIELASSLLLVAQGIINCQCDLFCYQREVARFVGRI